MDAGLKQRLIGAAVLVALAVIFLPMLVKGPAPDSGVSDLSMRVPDAPEGDYKTIDLPLVVPADAPQGGVLGTPEPVEGDPLPTVDTATAPRSEPAPDDDDAAELAAAPATPPPAATPAAEPKLPPTAAGGDYAVHFGAFANERDAQLVVRQLSEAGLTAYREAFTLNDKPAQRVRLGPYASREAAEAVRVRAAQVRNDVTPRVVALDAPVASTPPATPAPVAAKPVEAPRPAATPGPAETPAAPPPATAGVGFAVQVGAFGNAAEAQKLRDRLREQGITAFTDTVTTDKGRLTRVKAGPVPTRQDAERLKAQVRSKTGIDGMVRSHP
ncbi:sporulation protein [Luteimonas marina]|uniref:Sporulation protein n=1 Tax=Luteimonas marina TaxID=488485 RepID=A0A5C5TX32_9GAMM|nr:SPOR domain-containing protein [Luteimonas marina]TWT17872.1 sporulation protein [Luteimonas marina]